MYYLVWFGNGGTAQSYYNLPVLAPVCALFGIGVNALLASVKMVRWRSSAMVAVALAVAIPAVPVLRYLFKQDRQILAAAEWVREHTAPGDIVLVRANHRYDMIDYSYNPVVAYYSGRPTFIWTKLTGNHLRAAALERASYAVMTLPTPLPGGVAGKLNQLRGISAPQLQPLDWVEAGNFEPFTQEDGFATYKRRSAAGDH